MGIIAYLNLETPGNDGMTVTRFTALTAREQVEGGRRGQTKLALVARLEVDHLFESDDDTVESSQLDINPTEDRYTELLDRSLAGFEQSESAQTRDAASSLRALIAMGLAALSPPELEAANESDVEFVKFLRGIEALKVRARLA